MSRYLYGVIPRPGPQSRLSGRVLGKGVGDPPAPVELVPHGDTAALVSSVDTAQVGDAAGARALRRDMGAHTDTLARVMEHFTVLPVRFGVVFPGDQALIDDFLHPERDRLRGHLERLRGMVELSVRATLIEEEVLQEVTRGSRRLVDRLQQSQARASGARYHERIELGRQIALRIQARRDQDASWLADRFTLAAEDIRMAESTSDLTVFRGSVLVQRKKLENFDRVLEDIAAEAGSRMKLACVGPLPPYSFVELHVPASEA